MARRYCGVLTRLLKPRADQAYAVLRIVAGVLWAFHGMQKVTGLLTERTPAPFSQVWIGGWIELVAGILIALGLFTRWAAFIASGTMAVAYTQFHWKLRFDDNVFPAINKGELALIYAFLFLFIACRGPGIWSVDTRRPSESTSE